MVRISPAARKSKLLSAALKVRTIEPESEPAPMIVLKSAPASTSATPLGVGPPDEVIEDTLVLTALTSKLVNVSTPEGVVSRLPLPVVWAISVIAWPPETSATSTGLGVGFVTDGGGGLIGGSMGSLFGVALIVMVSGVGALF